MWKLHLSDCYRTRCPNTGLYQTVTTLIVQVLTFIGVTTLIVQALVILRLLPHSLFKYWHLSDCYHTHCPNTGLYQTVTTLIVQVLTFIGVAILIVQALLILRLLLCPAYLCILHNKNNNNKNTIYIIK